MVQDYEYVDFKGMCENQVRKQTFVGNGIVEIPYFTVSTVSVTVSISYKCPLFLQLGNGGPEGACAYLYE